MMANVRRLAISSWICDMRLRRYSAQPAIAQCDLEHG
jgi:hypothetical protein